MSLVVECVRMKARDLRPGDLFSSRGPAYWSGALSSMSVGEKVYVRTESPPANEPDGDELVYRLSFHTEPDA